MITRPVWATESGWPSLHTIKAALMVGALIDPEGSPVADARESYWHTATGGVFHPEDLGRAERLLVDAGLAVESEGRLRLTPGLEDILGGTLDDGVAAVGLRVVPYLDARSPSAADPSSGLLSELSSTTAGRLVDAMQGLYDDDYRRALGAAGEELVVRSARAELVALGHDDLARSVRRVSLESDAYGYDVVAPRVAGPARLLEVKTTSVELGGHDVITIYLSRNEAEVASHSRDWALVICAVADVEAADGDILGWSGAAELLAALPLDGPRSRWDSAAVRIERSALQGGLPRAAY